MDWTVRAGHDTPVNRAKHRPDWRSGFAAACRRAVSRVSLIRFSRCGFARANAFTSAFIRLERGPPSRGSVSRVSSNARFVHDQGENE